MIEIIFAAFALAAALLFRWAEPGRAVAITCFAGWLLLPVGNFPPGSADAAFAYWITGAAVPSDMVLTKMWWPPVVALAGALWRDGKTLLRLRPAWGDAPMVLFCLWPIMQAPFAMHGDPSPWAAALYLGAAWGAPWFLGRVYFHGPEGGIRLLGSLVWGLPVLVPMALLEGLVGPRVYGWFYEPHPFRFDGIHRFIGYRPLGFFEDGNQYGIWVAATALAAVALWHSQSTPGARRLLGAVAALALVIAFMSQSTGAILLLLVGLVVLWQRGRSVARWTLGAALAIACVGGAAFVSGRLPLRHLAQDTRVGREIVGTIREAKQGSILWRLARDQQVLGVLHRHPLVGTAQWDWWRPFHQRPWDLATLLLGQFGAIGLFLAFASLLMPAIAALRMPSLRLHRGSLPSSALAIIVLMGAADMLFNSFILYPAILAAGALVPLGKPSVARGLARTGTNSLATTRNARG